MPRPQPSCALGVSLVISLHHTLGVVNQYFMEDKDIFNDGLSLPDAWSLAKGLASSSLRIALKAYFSTYKALGLYNYPVINDLEDKNRDSSEGYPPDYYETYSETILHFHHFIELAFKDFLFEVHPLLAQDAFEKPVILHKLLIGPGPSPAELEGIYTVDFSTSLKRLKELIKADLLPKEELGFIVEESWWLKKLNNIRNRIWHKGTYIVKLKSLDAIVGKLILPFVYQLLDLPLIKEKYKETEWRYQKLECGYDPIDELISEFKKAKPSHSKVAFLKELGRAAYGNPLEPDPDLRILDGPTIRIAETGAENISRLTGVPARICPVCGLRSFLLYKNLDVINIIPKPGEDSLESFIKPEEVRCLCCGFNIDSSLKNPSAYDLNRIEDFGFKCE